VIVIDNSVLVKALIDTGPLGKACVARMSGQALAAPALIDLEAAHAVRGLLLAGKIEKGKAHRTIQRVPLLPISRVQHTDLLPRVWELRGNLTAYDAAYVALAEKLGAPLVTGDARLARGVGSAARCAVELMS
jgi:predicted nucleic acid-binding protein